MDEKIIKQIDDLISSISESDLSWHTKHSEIGKLKRMRKYIKREIQTIRPEEVDKNLDPAWLYDRPKNY